jgi:hypothetical protein
MMAQWIESGWAITLILAIILAEGLILLLVFQRRSFPLLLSLLPGACLMLALRAAILGQGAPVIALWLTAALPLHLADLWLRIKKGEPD